MKTGYSNWLGEYAEAHEITYQDINDFNIVCPACFEPVYKVVRGEQHFLAHRARELVKTQECELRVEGISQTVKAITNSTSRGQSIAFFFAALPTMINDIMPRTYGAWDSHQVDTHFARDANARRVRDFFHSYHVGRADETFDWGQPRAYKMFDGMMKDAEEAGERYDWEDGLDRTLQARIARDMLRTMCTPTGRRGFHHLFCGAWAYQWSITRRPHDRDADSENTRHLLAGAAELLGKPARGGNLYKAFMKARSDQLPYGAPGQTVGNILMTQFHASMVMILLRLDYAAYLKAWIAGEFDDHLRRTGATHLLNRAEALLNRAGTRAS